MQGWKRGNPIVNLLKVSYQALCATIANSHRSLYNIKTMKKLSRILSAALILMLLAGMTSLPGSAAAQNSSSVYVPETGHWIWGEFLNEYNSVDDPLLYFGYPITDDFVDSVTGQHVQYFQKARFDMVDTAQGAKVQLAPLGKLLHEEGAQLADIAADGPTCRRFKSGFSVCYAFLQFYDAYAGVTYFGNPVSELEVIDGRYVQYFENTRMEWWPERESGERVVLTDLGKVYFDRVVANPDLLKSSPPANIAGQLLKPIVRVFPQKSLIGGTESQTVFVVVQDQYLRAMPKAQVGLTAIFPDGTTEFFRLSETNEYGVSQVTFDVPGLAIQSVVTLKAEVTIRGEMATGTGWFRIWW